MHSHKHIIWVAGGVLVKSVQSSWTEAWTLSPWAWCLGPVLLLAPGLTLSQSHTQTCTPSLQNPLKAVVLCSDGIHRSQMGCDTLFVSTMRWDTKTHFHFEWFCLVKLTRQQTHSSTNITPYLKSCIWRCGSIRLSARWRVQIHDPPKTVMCIVFTFYLHLLIPTPTQDQNPKPLLIETQWCYKLRLLFLPPFHSHSSWHSSCTVVPQFCRASSPCKLSFAIKKQTQGWGGFWRFVEKWIRVVVYLLV